ANSAASRKMGSVDPSSRHDDIEFSEIASIPSHKRKKAGFLSRDPAFFKDLQWAKFLRAWSPCPRIARFGSALLGSHRPGRMRRGAYRVPRRSKASGDS